MYAVDDLSDAIDVTRDFLTPVHAWTWLRLALIVIFLGGVGIGFPGFTFDPVMLSDPGAEDPAVEAPSVTEILLVVAIIAAIVLPLYVVFGYLSALLEFVFVESLRSEEVHVRQYGKEYLGAGVYLFAFRFVFDLALLLLIGIPVGGILVLAPSDAALIASVIALIGWALLLVLLNAVIQHFTTVFVVPVMILKDYGILEAWRRFLPTLREDWKEYLVYLVLIWVLELVAGIAVGVIAFILFLPILIVYVPVAILLAITVVGIILLIPLTIVVVILYVLIQASVELPVLTYFRYYALLLLGDTDPDLDLIPDQRAAVREDGGGPGGAGDVHDEPGPGPGPGGAGVSAADRRGSEEYPSRPEYDEYPDRPEPDESPDEGSVDESLDRESGDYASGGDSESIVPEWETGDTNETDDTVGDRGDRHDEGDE